jgi:signal peptide peptidase SppA
MKYAHILMAITEERWAIQQAKLQAILDFLADQSAGAKYSAEELEARIGRGAEKAVAKQDGAVALIPIRGVIANRMSMMDDISGGTSSEALAKSFQAAVLDGAIKAIIFDVDSPGGAFSGCEELSSMIYAARGKKPIIAHVNSKAASAAYYIASAADEIVVTPSGSVGSIGVLGVHDDLSGALEQAGVKKSIISAGKFKADGNPFEPLDDATRARIQASVDSAYDMFVRAVARNRSVALSAVREGFGQGDMLDAGPALAEGMVDRIGTLEETLQRFGASQYGPAPKDKRAAEDSIELTALAADVPEPEDMKIETPRRAFAIEREKRALDL